MQYIDFLSITSDNEICKRLVAIKELFNFSFMLLPDFDSLLAAFDKDEIPICKFAIVSNDRIKDIQQTTESVQLIRQMAPEAYIVVAVNKKSTDEDLEFLRKSGCDLFIYQHEIMLTSKLEFISLQSISTSFIPIKATDLIENTRVDFPVLHLLPINRKYLPVLRKGETVKPEKAEKMKAVGEMYIKRQDLAIFREYSEANMDKTASGLASRCRIQFLDLNQKFIEIVMILSDDVKSMSFSKGKDLYISCQKLANEFITNLGSIGDAWAVIDNSSIGTSGSIERSPAIAAQAGLLSLKSGVGSVDDVMMAALFGDISLLHMSPKGMALLRTGRESELSAEDKETYLHHPVASVTRILNRRVPISNSVKEIMAMTHERADQKGFPEKPIPTRIPDEAQIVQFAELLDYSCKIEMGKERIKPEIAAKELIKKETDKPARFSFGVIDKLSRIF